jgi:uncharacterized protein YukE
MSMLGMDITGVRQLANQMNSASNEIQALSGQLTQLLGNTVWVGPDHDRFAADWHSTYMGQLQNVANALATAATVANQNAVQQETASNS